MTWQDSHRSGNMSVQERLAALRAEIAEITPEAAQTLQAQGATLVDVREPEEVAQGTPAQAQALSRGYLELRIGQLVPTHDATIMLMCGSGTRSLLAADDLRRLG